MSVIKGIEYRSIDGSGNNLQNPNWGKANIPLRRITRIGYSDGVSEPSGTDRPNPRVISNIVLDQRVRSFNFKNASDYLWAWGQFLDHDIGLTEIASPLEMFNIKIPKGDSWFDPYYTGNIIMPFNRSIYQTIDGIRQQLNTQSSFIDASNVYGSDDIRAHELRRNDGTGKLKTGPEGYLPYNLNRYPNAPNNNPHLYLAGDIRANEQPILASLHSLFLLEHNRIAHRLYYQDSNQSGDEIYQKARELVIAYIQHITFNEFLPILLGGDTISPYVGYNPNINPGILNVFSTACYRLGHSLVPSELLRLDENLNPISEGALSLKDAFFNPSMLTVDGGIEPLLRGAARQVCENLDARTVNVLRNFLFGNPGNGGMDLASLNIQRGRDHGLPGYNDVREDLGLTRKNSFEEITTDLETVARLREAYNNVDLVDVWVGGLAEDPYGQSMLGELFTKVCKLQFEALRDGDRFWYLNVFTGNNLQEIKSTRLIDIIRRNTRINDEIQDNVFQVK